MAAIMGWANPYAGKAPLMSCSWGIHRMKFRATSLLWISWLAIAASGGAQDQPTSTARELYYSPAPLSHGSGQSGSAVRKADTTKPAPDTGTPGRGNGREQSDGGAGQSSAQGSHPQLGLRYRVLKMELDGSFVSVPPESAFHAMDRIRLQLESNQAGYLYVICHASDSTWEVLFPSPKIQDNRNNLKAFEPLTIPTTQEFVFDRTPGTERVYVVLSEHPEEDLDALVKSVRSGPSPQEGQPELLAFQRTVVDAQTGPRARNLLISRPVEGETDGRVRDSVYLVDLSTQKARVMAEIPLRHE